MTEVEQPKASATVRIVNERGLHARAAAKFVRLAEGFAADITVSKDEITVPGTSILGLMMLTAGRGSALRLEASGRDAAAAIDALADLVERGFDE
ncbi:MAG TPA: HPr family phosphocarrier protein [Rhodospirillales bacterium]|nr:HPr family phosphocarrier protein [Rhodospirillales bacterium]